MIITSHRQWSRYTPVPFPEGVPSNVMFCRRDDDENDWYTYVRDETSFLSGSIKLTAIEQEGRYIIAAATTDASMLFPQGCIVLEITDHSSDDPQEEFGNREYDTANNVILPRDDTPPVPSIISRRQFYQQLALVETITKQEALDAIRIGAIPAAIQLMIDVIPVDDDKFNAEMLLSGATEFQRGHPLTAQIGAAQGMTEAEIDEFFREAAAI